MRIERDAADAIASQHAPGAGGTPGWATWVPVGAGAYALLTGLSTLIGWAADVPRLTDWKNDGMRDRELIEWLLYTAIGLCALIAHNVYSALR